MGCTVFVKKTDGMYSLHKKDWWDAQPPWKKLWDYSLHKKDYWDVQSPRKRLMGSQSPQERIMGCTACTRNTNGNNTALVRARFSCLSRVPNLTKVLPSIWLCCMQHRVTLYSDISRVYSNTGVQQSLFIGAWVCNNAVDFNEIAYRLSIRVHFKVGMISLWWNSPMSDGRLNINVCHIKPFVSLWLWKKCFLWVTEVWKLIWNRKRSYILARNVYAQYCVVFCLIVILSIPSEF